MALFSYKSYILNAAAGTLPSIISLYNMTILKRRCVMQNKPQKPEIDKSDVKKDNLKEKANTKGSSTTKTSKDGCGC
tara:strand:- start:518 stop:748 length:231 start_codon:yes stop_codon:yes gene_type:complete